MIETVLRGLIECLLVIPGVLMVAFGVERKKLWLFFLGWTVLFFGIEVLVAFRMAGAN